MFLLWILVNAKGKWGMKFKVVDERCLLKNGAKESFVVVLLLRESLSLLKWELKWLFLVLKLRKVTTRPSREILLLKD